MIRIRKAVSPEDIEAVRALFMEYEKYLDTDLCFQSFSEELRSLPGIYSKPDGALWLAFDGDKPVGCVAMKRHDAHASEMKRLFVKPEHQGKGIGKGLIEVVIAESKAIGYTQIKLDVLPKSGKAIEMYKSYGFSPATPYYKTDRQVYFFELDLGGRYNNSSVSISEQ